MVKSGKLIVIDGGDGSGKETQSKLLEKYLTETGKSVKYFDFPRYYSSFYGKLIGRYLSGEFGTMESVSPYLISVVYALDRVGAKEEMDDWLNKGNIIISNRYATSNLAHQAARVTDNKKQEFLEWIDQLEYKENKIPREDIVIYLYVPYKIGFDLTNKKSERGYTNGKKMDIAEENIKHRIESEKMYLKLAKTRKNWVLINCVNSKSELRTKEEIHKEVVKILRERKII